MNSDLIIMGSVSLWFLIVGGVVLLLPLSRRLGHLLEAMAKERAAHPDGPELRGVREALELLEDRLALIEERQEFTERLLRSGSDEEVEVEGG